MALYSRALLLLRKKKFQEQILATTDGQMENIERMVHDLEFAQVEIKVIDGLKIGNTALTKLHEILSIDEIEKVMDDTREGIDKQRELDELLMGTLTEEDEDEVEAELDNLLAEETSEKLPEIPVDVTPVDVTLPNVPDDKIVDEKGKKQKKINYDFLNLKKCFFCRTHRAFEKKRTSGIGSLTHNQAFFF